MTSANSRAGSHAARIKRIKSSYLSTREYDEAYMHKRFAGISEAMHARTEQELGFEPSDVTPRSLALLTGMLRAFVESALGKDSSPEARKITKFPHKLFLDYRPEGALYVLLCACLNFKYLHGLRRFEFLNIDKRAFYFDLLIRIEKSLKEARMLPMVKVFFARSIPTSAQPSLRAIVQKRGATVSSASAATHIVYPDPPGTTVQETANTDYCRVLELKDDVALVHWWYHPDSYDSWISRGDVDGDPENAEDHERPWHVQLRWLQDTELYNEWMNEADYDIPVEKRMTVIPPPRTETSPKVAPDVVGKAEIPINAENEDLKEHSKKRKRGSSSVANAQSQKSGGRGEDANIDDEMDLGNTSGSEIGSIVRKSKRNGDAGRQRSSKEGADNPKSRKEQGSHHQRKRARLSDEGRRGPSKPEPSQSVKVRLNLKAPLEMTKERVKDRGRDHRPREPTRKETRDLSADSRGGAGLKVRVKIPKPSDTRRKAEQGDRKPENKLRDSDNDDAMSVKSKLLSKSEGDIGSLKVGRIEKKDGSVDIEVSPEMELKSIPKTYDENGDLEKPDKDDGGQEQKRPFSRRKSKKKERSQVGRMEGVSVVEDAIPIPEGELPRIRNISNDGRDFSISKPNKSTQGVDNTSELEEEVMDVDDKQRIMKTENRDRKDEPAMDVDTNTPNGRVVAISEKMLAGDIANAPISGADIAESLPPVTIRMPAHSKWFRSDAIHDIEKRSLSEFFNNRSESKTPLVYKKYRDFMIDVWRQSPDKYLTATAARRHLAGDVCSILRVHAFLEHWGLINYGVEPESKPYLNSSIRARYSRPKPVYIDGHGREQVNGVPRLLFFDEPRPPKRENGPVSLVKAVKAAKEKSAGERAPSLLSRRELYAAAAATKYECDACGSDCSRMRYHCVGSADIELCPSCFANGEYPETLSARDFEQLTTVLGSEAYDGSVWSEAEVLLLLEGLEKYGEDWNQVAEHVGTKSNEQCVLQFLRMPIEDSFLGDQLGKWDVRPNGTMDGEVLQEGKCDGERKFAGPPLPFADTANPIMAQVAFLASSVSPEVAAAAAQAALHQLMSESGPKVKAAMEKSTDQANALLRSSDKPKEKEASQQGAKNYTNRTDSQLSGLPGTKLDAVAVEAAAAVGLAAAVAKARKLADAESREIEREFAVVVETKLRAVDLKLQEFDRLEKHVRIERERLEKQRQGVFADRVEVALMRNSSAIQASRVAAAHKAAAAAASVAAGGTLPAHGFPSGIAAQLRPVGVQQQQSNIVVPRSNQLVSQHNSVSGVLPMQNNSGPK